jgi:hypothetical protein
MPLASSGYIRMGGTDANRSVNLELSRSATATISFGEAAVRTLTGRSTGSVILPNDFWGKSSIAISLAPLVGVYGLAYPGNTAYAEYIFNSNGTIQTGTSDGGMQSAGNWATPTTTGIGSSYWIRFTQTGSSGGPITDTGNARGVWIQITPVLSFGISVTANGAFYKQYTVEIATDSGGSNIVATKTSVEIGAEIIF